MAAPWSPVGADNPSSIHAQPPWRKTMAAPDWRGYGRQPWQRPLALGRSLPRSHSGHLTISEPMCGYDCKRFKWAPYAAVLVDSPKMQAKKARVQHNLRGTVPTASPHEAEKQGHRATPASSLCGCGTQRGCSSTRQAGQQGCMVVSTGQVIRAAWQ
eukprot:1142759-Pelagomonas_calceolata.AAC.5